MRNCAKLAVVVTAVVVASAVAREASSAEWQAYRAKVVRELRAKDFARLEVTTRGLASFDGQAAAGVAIELLHHRNRRVSGAAQDALRQMRSPRSTQAMVAAFARPRSTAVRIALLRAFRGKRDARVNALLPRCLEVFSDAPQLVATLEAVEANAVASAAPKVVGLLDRRQKFAVRLSAVRALARTAGAVEVPALIGCLDPSEGRIRHEAAAALRALTGRMFGAEKSLWVKWWSGAARNAELVRAAPRVRGGPAAIARAAGKEDSRYHGIPVQAKRVIFILDKSDSMKRGTPRSRMETAKDELCRVIRSLDEDVRFNVIFFASRAIQWRPNRLVPANRLSRESAAMFIGGANPYGQTNTPQAMEMALTIARNHDAETIFLLTDGGPCVDGHFLEMDKVCAEITSANEFLKVRINVIGILHGAGGEASRRSKEPPREALRTFLRRLAAENEGRFVEL